MFDLTGKLAVVVGGSRGIGRACCEALARQGARVVVGYAQRADAAELVVQRVREAGGEAESLRLDLSHPAEAEATLAKTIQQLGRLDILVLSAGISIDGLLLRLKEEDLERQLTVNVKGSLGCARAGIKAMMRARQGRVIFLSSVVGETGNIGQTAYAATKAALLGITKSLAREYASRGVTVNAVAPGYITTEMTASLPEAVTSAMLQGIPLERAGTPEDVAAAVVFLASSEASYVTGQTLRVNGGMYV